MGNRERILSSEDLGQTTFDGKAYDNALITKVDYDEGGVSYFSGRSRPRGYYLTVSLETTRSEGNMRSRIFGLGDGTSITSIISEAKRFSAGALTKAQPSAEQTQRIREQVLANIERNRAQKAASG